MMINLDVAFWAGMAVFVLLLCLVLTIGAILDQQKIKRSWREYEKARQAYWDKNEKLAPGEKPLPPQVPNYLIPSKTVRELDKSPPTAVKANRSPTPPIIGTKRPEGIRRSAGPAVGRRFSSSGEDRMTNNLMLFPLILSDDTPAANECKVTGNDYTGPTDCTPNSPSPDSNSGGVCD